MQNVFFYIDDSGVFDKSNNDYLIHAGYVFFSKEEKDNASRKYLSVERKMKVRNNIPISTELKSYGLEAKHKNELFRSLNGFERFCCVISCHDITTEIYSHKKHKQRFLDYAIKRTIKDTLNKGRAKGLIDLSKPVQVSIFFDEHTTATSGKYELKEAIESELIIGTFNTGYRLFFPPILVPGSGIHLTYADSSKSVLVRASDIVANKAFYQYNFTDKDHLEIKSNLKLICCSKHP